ncbi:ergothioneine biosynthesis protein EgtB [Shewanella hanedai]|uniref:Ergothioneine biosynthesis protein EgtB n=1 Tax=Shewanella hanedai TaxID=25 RepID=A0A553JRC6_SHEHA|nr:ergothioneine biosynthesis protein EgtB [Shewanella hanedai]TRY15014.1 ergothioneine biosynthesis protein EgtB [Shewanella hanedai]GGI75576.1 ergothioneine biosynthesis protein EgtB [Shewanella hanedai]
MLSSDSKMLSARAELLDCYLSVRNDTDDICRPLAIEDHAVQPNAEVSPPKWHLGHTTWFFEELILVRFMPDYQRWNEQYRLLFNSYYKSAGQHWIQSERGNLSRPRVDEVLAYRAYVDHHMTLLLQSDIDEPEMEEVLEIGMHHEQQHQELLYMDIKFILGVNPMQVTYDDSFLPEAKGLFVKGVMSELPKTALNEANWETFEEGIYQLGYGGEHFAYDNESPRHNTYLYPFSIAKHTVSNGEYLAFINDEGYNTARYWLSMGWDWLVESHIKHPLYWQQEDGQWYEFTLHGRHVLDLNAPVTHISYFEADAFASWKGCRLPTEQEFEVYLQQNPSEQGLVTELHHPNNTSEDVGQVWCWTRSQYTAYPGFKPYKGMLEEYNGKFMCNQFVLKGGCIATPVGHYRHSYRNFYQPHQRWMFSGIRLSKDI